MSNFLVLCEGFTHLPHEQFSMPISHSQAQSGHCFLEEVSQSSKISVLPMSVINFFDFSLNVLISSVLFKSCRKNYLFGWLLNHFFERFSAIRVGGLKNEVCLVFNSRRCRCKFPRNFPMRFGGLRIFLLLDQVDLVVHFANSASEKSKQPWRLEYLAVLPLLSLHAYRFLNTNRRQCVVENDCV